MSKREKRKKRSIISVCIFFFVIILIVYIFPLRPYIIMDPNHVIGEIIPKREVYNLTEKYDAGLGPFDFPIVLLDRINDSSAIIRLIGIYGHVEVKYALTHSNELPNYTIKYLSPGEQQRYICWWD